MREGEGERGRGREREGEGGREREGEREEEGGREGGGEGGIADVHVYSVGLVYNNLFYC